MIDYYKAHFLKFAIALDLAIIAIVRNKTTLRVVCRITLIITKLLKTLKVMSNPDTKMSKPNSMAFTMYTPIAKTRNPTTADVWFLFLTPK